MKRGIWIAQGFDIWRVKAEQYPVLEVEGREIQTSNKVRCARLRTCDFLLGRRWILQHLRALKPRWGSGSAGRSRLGAGRNPPPRVALEVRLQDNTGPFQLYNTSTFIQRLLGPDRGTRGCQVSHRHALGRERRNPWQCQSGSILGRAEPRLQAAMPPAGVRGAQLRGTVAGSVQRFWM